jgi:hypothetical protein
MDIWATHITRHAHCAARCGEEILKGEPVIKGRVYRPGRSTHLNWHLMCWWEQTLDHLATHPFTPQIGGSGRPSLNLTPEQYRRRAALLAKHYRFKKKIIFAIGEGLFWRRDELYLEEKDMIKEMEILGGIPKSWR